MDKVATYNDYGVYRVKSDINGNPRYVIHFKALSDTYCSLELVKKYRGKEFGGGYVFSTYDNINRFLDAVIERNS